MKTYDIYVTKRGVERYSVRANTPEEALEKQKDGTATLKDDETTDVEEIQVVDRATGQDVTPAEPEEEHGPVLKTYGVRFWATFRACAETQVEAFNEEGAVAVAKTIDWTELDFTADRENLTAEGDETAHLFGPSDDEHDNDDPWCGNAREIDLRDEGEPFSWIAVAIVKDLAKVSYQGRKDLMELIDRAKAACTKMED
ncbi:hypothetical protein EHS39_36210 [Ensifer sp. MPMI2T]|nr:hypothetical protein EHS39_36210 [Ensifer sp. MPMI2T]